MLISIVWFGLNLLLTPNPSYHCHGVRLGDTWVILEQQQHGVGKSFIHLHQNETTALTAAYSLLETQGGRVLTLIHEGGRNVVFHLDQQRYEFDPNRIFTTTGIEKTLSQWGDSSPKAILEVQRLAEAIKQALPEGKIIAVHNNREYSLKDYLPGHDLATDAESLYVNPQHFFRNFYLVTQKKDHERFCQLQFNSILQATTAIDDGSLSVFLVGRDYINVEAGYDQLVMQIKMLQWA